MLRLLLDAPKRIGVASFPPLLDLFAVRLKYRERRLGLLMRLQKPLVLRGEPLVLLDEQALFVFPSELLELRFGARVWYGACVTVTVTVTRPLNNSR